MTISFANIEDNILCTYNLLVEEVENEMKLVWVTTELSTEWHLMDGWDILIICIWRSAKKIHYRPHCRLFQYVAPFIKHNTGRIRSTYSTKLHSCYMKMFITRGRCITASKIHGSRGDCLQKGNIVQEMLEGNIEENCNWDLYRL